MYVVKVILAIILCLLFAIWFDDFRKHHSP